MRKVSGERGGGAWERRIGWAKKGVLAPDSEFRWIGWAVGTGVNIGMVWHGRGLGIRLWWEGWEGWRGEGARGFKGLSQQKCRKVKMEGEMRAGSPNVLHYRITRAW